MSEPTKISDSKGDHFYFRNWSEAEAYAKANGLFGPAQGTAAQCRVSTYEVKAPAPCYGAVGRFARRYRDF